MYFGKFLNASSKNWRSLPKLSNSKPFFRSEELWKNWIISKISLNSPVDQKFSLDEAGNPIFTLQSWPLITGYLDLPTIRARTKNSNQQNLRNLAWGVEKKMAENQSRNKNQ